MMPNGNRPVTMWMKMELLPIFGRSTLWRIRFCLSIIDADVNEKERGIVQQSTTNISAKAKSKL